MRVGVAPLGDGAVVLAKHVDGRTGWPGAHTVCRAAPRLIWVSFDDALPWCPRRPVTWVASGHG